MTEQIKKNGLLIRPFKHLYCGLIRGHKWTPISPLIDGYYGKRCVYCGKEKIF